MFPNKLKSKGGPSTDSVGAKAPKAVGPSTISCPDHLKMADLTVAKSLGPAKKCAVKIVGRKMCREKGERVHICIRCNFPIAIYGRLSPCQHAFCLDCAKTDPTCYICKEHIEKIHPIKLLEGIWICSAPQCLMSYLKKDEFEDHVLKNHGDILIPCPRKGEENESEAAISAGKPTIESTVQVPAKSALSLSSSSLQRDQDGGKQPKLEPTILGPTPNVAPDTILGNSNPQGFNRVDAPNRFLQDDVGLQGRHPQEHGQNQNSQLGVLSKNPAPHNAIQFNQPPDMGMPPSPNLFPIPSPFSHPQFEHSKPDGEQWQGAMSGFPPHPVVESVNFLGNSYPQPRGVGQSGGIFDHSLVGRKNVDAFENLSMSDTHERVAVFQGNVQESKSSNLVLYPAPANKDVEHLSGQHAIGPRNVTGMLPPPSGSDPPFTSQLSGPSITAGGRRNAQAPGGKPEHRNNS